MPAIVIYGPQGCGKTLRAADMKAHFGKARVVAAEEFLFKYLPDDAVVLSNSKEWAGRMQRYGQPIETMAFDAFLAEAGLVEKHAAEMRSVRGG